MKDNTRYVLIRPGSATEPTGLIEITLELAPALLPLVRKGRLKVVRVKGVAAIVERTEASSKDTLNVNIMMDVVCHVLVFSVQENKFVWRLDEKDTKSEDIT